MIQDAPWIREAEIYGDDVLPDVYCPVCGEENPEDFYVDDSGDVTGCSCCVKRIDPYEWFAERGTD